MSHYQKKFRFPVDILQNEKVLKMNFPQTINSFCKLTPRLIFKPPVNIIIFDLERVCLDRFELYQAIRKAGNDFSPISVKWCQYLVMHPLPEELSQQKEQNKYFEEDQLGYLIFALGKVLFIRIKHGNFLRAEITLT